VARDGDHLIGLLGLNEMGFNVFGEKGFAVWASLWYARPEYRRHAVGARLWQWIVKAGYTAVCMIGMNPSVRPFFRSLRYEILVDTPRWLGVLDPDRAQAFLSENPETNAAEVCSLVDDTTLNSAVSPGGDFDIVEWDDSLWEAWDRAWNQRFAPTIVGTDKPAEYLSWRYARHPLFRYRMRVARCGERIDGLLVTRLETPRGRSEVILRVIELLGEPEALRALVADELEKARAEKALFADFHAVSGRFARPLEDLGFGRLDPESAGALVPHRFQPLQFGHIPLTSAFHLADAFRKRVPKLLECEDFHISRADGDQDRPS
jgi:hypothetical protein